MRKFLPFSNYYSLKFFDCTEFLVIVNLLLKSSSDSIVNGIFLCHPRIAAIEVISICGQTDVSLKCV